MCYQSKRHSRLKAQLPSSSAAGRLPSANTEAGTPEYVYLGRQPILERSGALIAFELLFRPGEANSAQVTDDAEATAQVITRLIGNMGMSATLGDHTGYVNVDRTVLMSGLLQLLPRALVLEILETVTFDEALFRRCNDLLRAGFRFALDDVSEVSARLLELLPCADVVKIDLRGAQDSYMVAPVLPGFQFVLPGR